MRLWIPIDTTCVNVYDDDGPTPPGFKRMVNDGTNRDIADDERVVGPRRTARVHLGVGGVVNLSYTHPLEVWDADSYEKYRSESDYRKYGQK